MDLQTLQITWFVLLGFLLAGYAVLDGFDFGVGMLHPFAARTDDERRTVLNSIGPLWDGNEVWLVVFGGALFAMFPDAYASIFSGFYLALFLLLACLILRAVSIEFRSKAHGARWRGGWDWTFCIASGGASLVFGIAVGNAMVGLPLDELGNVQGGLLLQLRPYPVLVGLLAMSMFALHGGIYLYLKTEGALQERLTPMIWRAFGVFLVVFMLVTIFTLSSVPRATRNFEQHPWMWAVPVLAVLAIANIPRAMFHRQAKYAFISSSCTILAMVFLLMVASFPNLVSNVEASGRSVTIFDASSSAKTLWIGLMFAVIGMPLVLTYTVLIYRSFWGKVRLDAHSY